MKDGIGKERTREDHSDVASQLYSSYARFESVQSLATIIGEEGLSNQDKDYLRFGKALNQQFINQGKTENRSIDDTLGKAWETLAILPEEELNRIRLPFVKKYSVQRMQEGT